MQQVVNGVFLGSIYALFAMGYTLVFGVLDLLNLAHSAVFMIGAFVGLQLVVAAGLPLWLAIILTPGRRRGDRCRDRARGLRPAP